MQKPLSCVVQLVLTGQRSYPHEQRVKIKAQEDSRVHSFTGSETRISADSYETLPASPCTRG